MTQFRSIDQIQADFRARERPFDLEFTQVTRQVTGPNAGVSGLEYLTGLLTDDQLGEAAVYASGNGPVLFDLGVLSGPEWNGVTQFLNSRLVGADTRREFQRFLSDVRAADSNHDNVLTNQELVAYAQSHTDRWPNVAQFRNAAEIFLNRLPAYVNQDNLTRDQVRRLQGVLNHIAREHDRLGTPEANRGTVYGLSLRGFPSEDVNNPPDLIRRAMAGTLTPQELAAVHHVLETQMVDGQYVFRDGAPMTPLDIGLLGEILDRAAASGHSLYGMRLVRGEDETRLFAERNQAAQRCLDGTRTAIASGNGLEAAFTGCSTEMARLEGQNSDRIGVRSLLMRAYTGDLSAAETVMLRRWMQQEATALGMSCNGTLDCLAQGAAQLFQSIAANPWHFIARNGAFMGGAWLYRRLVLRNAFENRLSQACGGQVINPGEAYRQYERHLSEQMRNSPVWRRFLNQLARNPRRESLLGRGFINFPVTFLHLAAFNAIASRKDTGNDFIDIPTDLPLIPLFEAFDTYDAFNRTAIQNFAQANPGLCRPQGQAAEQPAEAPAPERETNPAAQFAPLSEEALRAMSRDQLATYVRGPYGQWTQQQFEEAMNGAPALTPLQIASLPEGLRPLFDADLHWGAVAEPQVTQLRSTLPQVADLLVDRYAQGNSELARMIREDVAAIRSVHDGERSNVPEAELSARVRWALRQYIGNLQSGGLIRSSFYVPMIRDRGLVSTYMAIRASQECSLGCINQAISFAEAARQNLEMRTSSLYNRLHAAPSPAPSANPSPSHGEALDMMPRTADGQPMIFIPLPCGMAGSAIGALRSLFGFGEAAVGTEQTIQWGAYALGGA